MKTRKTYNKDFKEKAVALSEVRGNTSEVAEELGIRPEILRRWKREFKQLKNNSFPGNGKAKMTDEERELAQLRKELIETRMERDILKKAISIFSVSDRKSTNL
jgi:transposase